MIDCGSDWRLDLLPNGLRLVTILRPGSSTVSVRATIRAGSRYDVQEAGPDGSPPPLGLAHLIEHLLFKGTRTHSQRQLFATIERLGGLLEGSTTKEYTTLYAVVRRQHLAEAVDLLASILVGPALREEDFWREKLVLLEEIRSRQDRQAVLLELFAQTLWRVHPLRHPPQGTLEGLQVVDYETLCAVHGRRYVAGNMVVAVCGAIDRDRTGCLLAESLKDLPPGAEQPPFPVEEPTLAGIRMAHLVKDLHQTHLLVGVPTVSMKHGDRSALKVIERILGMGASARLYQRLREEEQLVYNIRGLAAHYEDAGFFAIYAACHPRNVARVQALILEEWDKLGCQGVSEEEMDAAKGNYAGTLSRRFETGLALTSIAGVEGLLHRIETLEEAVGRIHAVKRDDVVRVARAYLGGGRHIAVSLGPEAAG
jgi:predicted Zn-dependent peptidase